MITLKGKKIVEKLRNEIVGNNQLLAIVIVGNNRDDALYTKSIMQRVKDCGMHVNIICMRELDNEKIKSLNDNPKIDGIIILNGKSDLIDSKKDLDGMTDDSIAKVFKGDRTGFAPCTAEAVIEILKGYNIEIEGKHAVIVGRSMTVGRPLGMLLLRENATVTIAHSKSENLKEICKSADILISCIGKAKVLNKDYIKKGAVVIDVGMNEDENGQICGDIDSEGLNDIAFAYTPVPGGVGPVTSAVLAKHLSMVKRNK